MQCMVCGSPMSFYFAKEFNAYGLGTVEYWQCEHCRFVASKTHSELTTKQWELFDQAVGELEHDPSDERWEPILYDNDEREIDYKGLWIRYALRAGTHDLILLKVVPVADVDLEIGD